MALPKILKVILIILIAGLLTGAYYTLYVRGNVVGDKPWYKPNTTLENCDFNGSEFVNTPCYVPPGVGYD